MILGRAFEFLCFGFLAGVALASLVFVSIFFTEVIIVFSLILLCYSLFLQPQFFQNGVLCALLFLALCLGVFRYQEKDFFDHTILRYDGESVTLVGMISDEPDVRQDNTHLTVTVLSVNGIPQGGKVVLVVERYPVFVYGEEVSVQGVLTKPARIKSDDGRDFDYEKYLALDEISALMVKPRVEKIAGAALSFQGELFAFKAKFISVLRQEIVEPYASFLAGLLVGAKHALSSEWLARFRDVGLVHVVVLSGYNITIVADSVLKLLGRLSFISASFSYGVSAIAIILFVLMAGPSATVVRAGIMALLVVLSKAVRREYAIKRALLVAAVVMVFWKPKSLLFDTSFQLSFLATLALIYVSPMLEERIRFLSRYKTIHGILISTLATQITVLPLILYTTGTFSVIAPISNLLILPFIPLTMFFGFLSGAIGLLHPLLATPLSMIAYLLTFVELKVVEWFSSFSFSAFSIPRFPEWVLIFSYILLFGFFLKLKKIGAKKPL